MDPFTLLSTDESRWHVAWASTDVKAEPACVHYQAWTLPLPTQPECKPTIAGVAGTPWEADSELARREEPHRGNTVSEQEIDSTERKMDMSCLHHSIFVPVFCLYASCNLDSTSSLRRLVSSCLFKTPARICI